VEEVIDDVEEHVGTRDVAVAGGAAKTGTRDAGVDGRGLLGRSPFFEPMVPWDEDGHRWPPR